MSDSGWVKLWRKSTDSGLMQNPDLWLFWCWCLLKATHKPKKQMVGFQVVELQPGQFVFGRKKAATELPLSEQTVRTCVKKLETLQNLTIKSTNKFSIITIVNWDAYQEINQQDNQQDNQQVTSSQPAANHKQEVKECKNKPIRNGIPDFINKELWQAFRDHRKTLGKKMNDHAEKLIFAKLQKAKDKGHDPHEMIETAIERGWQSVFEPKPSSKPKQKDSYPI